MKKGFTVIELVLVILVIGILVSIFFFATGVLDSTKANAIVTEISYFKNAHDSFREKFAYRPGDIPSAVLTSQGFTGNAADVSCATLGVLGNNTWDDDYEKNMVWNQLSSQKFIRQQINFDPCPTPAKNVVGTHRPASDVVAGAGWTYLTWDYVTVGATTYNFMYVLRIGQPNGASDKDLAKGNIKSKIHMMVDTKIDTPLTPTSGKYYVQSACVNSVTGAYKGENDPSECTGGYSEIHSDDLKETYTP